MPTCTVVPTAHLDAANKIWNFLRLNDRLQKSDVILGLGSHDTRVAVESARLWLAGWADILVFSGCSGNLTSGKWKKSEAEIFRGIAISMGVPPKSILTEEKSKNTGENIRFTYRLLASKNLLPKKIIIVQKPHMGLRTIATFTKQWPGMKELTRQDITVRTPEIVINRYPSDDVGDMRNVITVAMGYFQRLDLYFTLNFQNYVEIPRDVQRSYELLAKTNLYESHLVKR